MLQRKTVSELDNLTREELVEYTKDLDKELLYIQLNNYRLQQDLINANTNKLNELIKKEHPESDK